jgi:hypothetical protein
MVRLLRRLPTCSRVWYARLLVATAGSPSGNPREPLLPAAACASSLFDTETNLQAFPAYRGRGYRSLNAVHAYTVSLHCCCHFQGSRRSRRRERCAAPPTLVSNPSRAAAEASSGRPCLLGPFEPLLEWLEGKSGGGEASHRCGLASQGLQTLLAVEKSKARSRPTSNLRRTSRVDHRDGRDECRLGGSPNSR